MADVKKCFMCDNARINDELNDENKGCTIAQGVVL